MATLTTGPIALVKVTIWSARITYASGSSAEMLTPASFASTATSGPAPRSSDHSPARGRAPPRA